MLCFNYMPELQDSSAKDMEIFYIIWKPWVTERSLSIPLHDCHRRNIHLPPLHHIIACSPQRDGPKHQNIPIHRIRLYRRRRRKEAEDEKRNQEHQSNDVDRCSCTTQGPARCRQCFATQTFGEDATYRKHVGS